MTRNRATYHREYYARTKKRRCECAREKRQRNLRLYWAQWLIKELRQL